MWLKLTMSWLNIGGLPPHEGPDSDNEDLPPPPPHTPFYYDRNVEIDWAPCLEWVVWAKLGPANDEIQTGPRCS